jgi:hypothetical protein
MKIGRNDPCPCGSGKKFKKCHLGREDELPSGDSGEITEEISQRITSLPEVDYGRCLEMSEGLDLKELTGNSLGIKWVDLRKYKGLDIFGSGGEQGAEHKGGSVFINIHKTKITDPDNIYLAISKDIDDSTLIHQLAHVLDYLDGSGLLPGTLTPHSYEFDLPVEHLEHTEEFGAWLGRLKDKFDVELDADDTIIHYLYENGRLIKGELIHSKNGPMLRSLSEGILRFLSENSAEIDALIKGRPGYIGERNP